LFQTHVYDGGSAQNIVNGIDLSNKGGLIWTKSRSHALDHGLFDSENSNFGSYLSSNNQAASSSLSGHVTANTNGFSLDSTGYGPTNANNVEYVSWTFRKQPKFFDIVTYSGTGSNQNISHNLGSVPGMILIKDYSASNAWAVYHRGVDGSAPEDYALNLGADSARDDATSYFNDTAPTSSVFTVGTTARTNNNGSTYVAYLFAHNNDDGGFGEPGDQDIIKCGSYTGNTSGTEVNLGFEPQFVMIKKSSASESWYVYDSMRGVATGGANSQDKKLRWNSTGAEGAVASPIIAFSANGFILESTDNEINGSGTYVYMAIRRGGMQTPTTPSDVFAINIRSSSDGEGKYTSGFPVDFSIAKVYDETGNFFAGTRLINQHLQTNDDVTAGSSASDYEWDHNDGVSIGASGAFFGSSKNIINYMWKRARGYFDVVVYEGPSTTGNFSHNLGVVPEMIWVKNTDATENWAVYHKDLGNTYNPETHYIRLNQNNAEADSADWWNDTAPTASVFSVGTQGQVNTSGNNYIAYLFATVAGVTKLGSYTGNDGTTNVDCGFTNGARFVLIKKMNGTGDWVVLDSERGIVDGNTPYLRLNTTDAQDNLGARDIIDPLASGFTINANMGGVNDNGDTFLFYAIAADPS